jgi:hypothetical protein
LWALCPLPLLRHARHSCSKNGVASLAYDPRINADWSKNRDRSMDCRIKSGNDDFPTPLGYFPPSW